MRRRAMALVLIVLFLLTTAACGAERASGGPIRLTMWARSGQETFIREIVNEFNRTHPNIQIGLTIVPVNNFVQKLGVAVAGDAGPDIASIDVVYLPLFASSGVLTDITERSRELPYLDRLSRGHRDYAEFEGRTYALPFSGDASVLYYNKDLFRRAGLDPQRPPRSWHEMYTAAKKIRALGGDRYGYFFSGASGGSNIFTFTPLIWASGGQVLAGPPGAERPTVATDPVVTDALGFYRKMWTEGLVHPQSAADDGAEAINSFGSGNIGMYANGAFVLETLLEDYPKLDFGVTLIPGRTGGSSSFVGGDDLAITRNSRHPDAAWTFLKWATSPGVQQRYVGREGVVPVHNDVALGPYSATSPENATFARALNIGRTVRSAQENALFNSDTSPWVNMISRGVFEENPKQAAEQAHADMLNILSRG